MLTLAELQNQTFFIAMGLIFARITYKNEMSLQDSNFNKIAGKGSKRKKIPQGGSHYLITIHPVGNS